MFDKLETVVNRYEQIGMELTRPEIVSDNEQFRKLMKEHSELTPIVEKFKEYSDAKKLEADSLSLLSEAGLDKELKEIAEEELKEAKENIIKFSFCDMHFFYIQGDRKKRGRTDKLNRRVTRDSTMVRLG